jgi:hypothetical protein
MKQLKARKVKLQNKVNQQDVIVLVRELEISKFQAEQLLVSSGSLADALSAFVNKDA